MIFNLIFNNLDVILFFILPLFFINREDTYKIILFYIILLSLLLLVFRLVSGGNLKADSSIIVNFLKSTLNIQSLHCLQFIFLISLLVTKYNGLSRVCYLLFWFVILYIVSGLISSLLTYTHKLSNISIIGGNKKLSFDLNSALLNGVFFIHSWVFSFNSAVISFLFILVFYYKKIIFRKDANVNSAKRIFIITSNCLLELFFFLSFALITGSWWAQQELNWNGWWSWDSIELITLAQLFVLVCAIHYNGFLSSYKFVYIYIFFFFLGSILLRFNLIFTRHAFNVDSKTLQHSFYGIYIILFFLKSGVLVYYKLFFRNFFSRAFILVYSRVSLHFYYAYILFSFYFLYPIKLMLFVFLFKFFFSWYVTFFVDMDIDHLIYFSLFTICFLLVKPSFVLFLNNKIPVFLLNFLILFVFSWVKAFTLNYRFKFFIVKYSWRVNTSYISPLKSFFIRVFHHFLFLVFSVFILVHLNQNIMVPLSFFSSPLYIDDVIVKATSHYSSYKAVIYYFSFIFAVQPLGGENFNLVLDYAFLSSNSLLELVCYRFSSFINKTLYSCYKSNILVTNYAGLEILLTDLFYTFTFIFIFMFFFYKLYYM